MLMRVAGATPVHPSRPVAAVSLNPRAVPPAPAEMREAVTFIREMGGEALLARVRDLFLQSAEQRLRAAHIALAAGDRVAVRKHAHSLCGGAAQWGAVAAHAAAAVLEGCAEAADPGTLRRLLDELDLGLADARVQLFAVDDEPSEARR